MTRVTHATRYAFARAHHHRASLASSPVTPPPLACARVLRRRRSLGRSIACTRCGVGGRGGGRLHRAPRASRTLRASLVTRTHAYIITASCASSPFSVPPAHDRHARAAAAAALARSLDRAHTVWRWRWRWRWVARGRLHRASCASRVRACVINAHRARHHRPLSRCQPCARTAFPCCSLICCCVCRHAAHRTCARDLGPLVSATPPCMTPHILCNTHGTHATHNTTRRQQHGDHDDDPRACSGGGGGGGARSFARSLARSRARAHVRWRLRWRWRSRPITRVHLMTRVPCHTHTWGL